MVHELKIMPYNFRLIELGTKSFEIRFNDRNYKVGDILILRQYYEGKYLNRQIIAKVNAILYNCIGVEKGYVVLLIEKMKYEEEK